MMTKFKYGNTGTITKKYLIVFVLVLLPVITFFILNLIYPLPVKELRRDKSTVVYSRDGELLSLYLSGDDHWRFDSDIEEIPEFFKKALIEYEDRWFYSHPGINPFSLLRALVVNVRSGRTVCGGSTLTMQVARMMEPKPRTFRSKLIEMFRAIQLESKFSKQEILEFYFNLAPYGGNIEGIAAASYFYFGKSPAVLSKSDSLTLVGLPNSPTHLRPDKHPDRSRKHRDRIANLMMERRLITHDEYQDILTDELPRTRYPVPQLVPHFSRLVKEKNPGMDRIKSTIDLKKQKLCEDLLKQHLDPMTELGITNGSIIVIENKSGAVRAMVGSRDFGDSLISGQVNGSIAPRSPGSAMKPFAYALAFDEGLVSPRMMLVDVPVNYSGYTPVNFDNEYHGGIPAMDALKYSLNVPVINIHSQLGDRFFNFLKSGGITTLDKPREHYGLPLVLGSGEVTLLELTNLYSILANDGFSQEYQLVEKTDNAKPRQILSNASCYIVSEILADIKRPDLPDSWESTVSANKIAWKTGTSYGHRDAWSIGYNPEYTIGVWIGNFSSQEAEELVGVEVAAPLLFEIFNSISTSSEWFKKPDSVNTRLVCTVSGMPPNGDCPHTIDEIFIPGKSPAMKCSIHQRFFIDNETGLRLAMSNKHLREHTQRVFEILPEKIATWRKRMGYPVDEVPNLFTESDYFTKGNPPIINSPLNFSSFILRKNVPLEHQKILLEASVSNTKNNLFWFVDGELLSQNSPDKNQFYYPKIGKHKITCMDNDGFSSFVTIEIR
ncbi:MAG: penicillin-binding protein 1C [bacterium]